jgi:alkanesulfonate monooxygenase SsuD/methylene tetrahydromethanopterin reductase-like flavin-dependent oxidoreductase (luciferase family)
MEFGVFHDFPRRVGQSEAEAFAEGMSLVDLAERAGIDILWLAEFHLNTRTVLASPLAVAAAIAGRTQRIRIGTAVQVLPLGDPLRLAEEWATVDQISRGRLIFGVGRASSPRSYLAYGIPHAESRERLAETLEIMLRAWTEPSFSYEGTYFHYSNVALSPRPHQQPHPPIRVAATSSETYAQLGTQGHAILTAVGSGGIAELATDLATYRAAHRAAGQTSGGDVYLRIPVYVAATEEKAIAEPRESLMQSYQQAAAHITQIATLSESADLDRSAARAQALTRLSYEQVRRDNVIVGTPAQVAERLQELRDQLGIQGILADLNSGREIPPAQVRHSLELLAAEVMPRFR